MPVYVDEALIPFGRMQMSHLWADSTEELLAMVDRIGVQRKWIQYPGHPEREHFDVYKSKRELAIKAGAVAMSWKSWAQAKRKENHDGPNQTSD